MKSTGIELQQSKGSTGKQKGCEDAKSVGKWMLKKYGKLALKGMRFKLKELMMRLQTKKHSNWTRTHPENFFGFFSFLLHYANAFLTQNCSGPWGEK